MGVCVDVYMCELLCSPALNSFRDWFLKSVSLGLAIL